MASSDMSQVLLLPSNPFALHLLSICSCCFVILLSTCAGLGFFDETWTHMEFQVLYVLFEILETLKEHKGASEPKQASSWPSFAFLQ